MTREARVEYGDKPIHEMKENKQRDEILDYSSTGLHELILDKTHCSLQILTQLIIDFNSISALPDDFVNSLPNLEMLSASGNDIKVLPQNFGALKRLQKVNLCENCLSILPDSVQHLENLQVLRLTGNKLACLPVDFGEIGGLEELHIEENALTCFPPTFALLSKLKILEASYNKLHILPRYIGSMESLQSINLSHNLLKEIPRSFAELQHLSCIDFSHNKLKELPQTSRSQHTLKKFFAGFNALEWIPEWLGHLPELTNLCLRENLLSGPLLPADMGKVFFDFVHGMVIGMCFFFSNVIKISYIQIYKKCNKQPKCTCFCDIDSSTKLFLYMMYYPAKIYKYIKALYISFLILGSLYDFTGVQETTIFGSLWQPPDRITRKFWGTGMSGVCSFWKQV